MPTAAGNPTPAEIVERIAQALGVNQQAQPTGAGQGRAVGVGDDDMSGPAYGSPAWWRLQELDAKMRRGTPLTTEEQRQYNQLRMLGPSSTPTSTPAPATPTTGPAYPGAPSPSAPATSTQVPSPSPSPTPGPMYPGPAGTVNGPPVPGSSSDAEAADRGNFQPGGPIVTPSAPPTLEGGGPSTAENQYQTAVRMFFSNQPITEAQRAAINARGVISRPVMGADGKPQPGVVEYSDNTRGSVPVGQEKQWEIIARNERAGTVTYGPTDPTSGRAAITIEAGPPQPKDIPPVSYGNKVDGNGDLWYIPNDGSPAFNTHVNIPKETDPTRVTSQYSDGMIFTYLDGRFQGITYAPQTIKTSTGSIIRVSPDGQQQVLYESDEDKALYSRLQVVEGVFWGFRRGGDGTPERLPDASQPAPQPKVTQGPGGALYSYDPQHPENIHPITAGDPKKQIVQDQATGQFLVVNVDTGEASPVSGQAKRFQKPFEIGNKLYDANIFAERGEYVEVKPPGQDRHAPIIVDGKAYDWDVYQKTGTLEPLGGSPREPAKPLGGGYMWVPGGGTVTYEPKSWSEGSLQTKTYDTSGIVMPGTYDTPFNAPTGRTYAPGPGEDPRTQMPKSLQTAIRLAAFNDPNYQPHRPLGWDPQNLGQSSWNAGRDDYQQAVATDPYRGMQAGDQIERGYPDQSSGWQAQDMAPASSTPSGWAGPPERSMVEPPKPPSIQQPQPSRPMTVPGDWNMNGIPDDREDTGGSDWGGPDWGGGSGNESDWWGSGQDVGAGADLSYSMKQQGMPWRQMPQNFQRRMHMQGIVGHGEEFRDGPDVYGNASDQTPSGPYNALVGLGSDGWGTAEGRLGWGESAPPLNPQDVVGTGHKWLEPVSMEGVHKGLDLQAYQGTPALSPVDGTVVKVEYDERGLGLQVTVQGQNGEMHKLSHLLDTQVKEGDPVTAGQEIAQVGSTGAGSTGPHLDYRIMSPDGQYQNPEPRLGWMAQMPRADDGSEPGQGQDVGVGLGVAPANTPGITQTGTAIGNNNSSSGNVSGSLLAATYTYPTYSQQPGSNTSAAPPYYTQTGGSTGPGYNPLTQITAADQAGLNIQQQNANTNAQNAATNAAAAAASAVSPTGYQQASLDQNAAQFQQQFGFSLFQASQNGQQWAATFQQNGQQIEQRHNEFQATLGQQQAQLAEQIRQFGMTNSLQTQQLQLQQQGQAADQQYRTDLMNNNNAQHGLDLAQQLQLNGDDHVFQAGLASAQNALQAQQLQISRQSLDQQHDLHMADLAQSATFHGEDQQLARDRMTADTQYQEARLGLDTRIADANIAQVTTNTDLAQARMDMDFANHKDDQKYRYDALAVQQQAASAQAAAEQARAAVDQQRVAVESMRAANDAQYQSGQLQLGNRSQAWQEQYQGAQLQLQTMIANTDNAFKQVQMQNEQMRIGLEQGQLSVQQAAQQATQAYQTGQLQQGQQSLQQQADQFSQTYGLQATNAANDLWSKQQDVALRQQSLDNQNNQFGQSFGLQAQQVAAQISQSQADLAMRQQSLNVNIAQFEQTSGLQRQQLQATIEAQQADVQIRKQQLTDQQTQFGQTFGLQAAGQANQLWTSQQDVALRTQSLQQQNDQFGQTFGVQAAQAASQIATAQADIALRTEAQKTQQGQFGQSLDVQKDQLAATIQNQQADVALRTQALQQNQSQFQTSTGVQRDQLAATIAQQQADLQMRQQQLDQNQSQYQQSFGLQAASTQSNIATQQADIALRTSAQGIQQEQFGATLGLSTAQLEQSIRAQQDDVVVRRQQLAQTQSQFETSTGVNREQFASSMAQQQADLAQKEKALAQNQQQFASSQSQQASQFGVTSGLTQRAQDIQQSQFGMTLEQQKAQQAQQESQYQQSYGLDVYKATAQTDIQQQQLDINRGTLQATLDQNQKNYQLGLAKLQQDYSFHGDDQQYRYDKMNLDAQFQQKQLDLTYQLKQMDDYQRELDRQNVVLTQGTFGQKQNAELQQSALKNPWLQSLTGMAPGWNQPGGPGYQAQQAAATAGGPAPGWVQQAGSQPAPQAQPQPQYSSAPPAPSGWSGGGAAPQTQPPPAQPPQSLGAQMGGQQGSQGSGWNAQGNQQPTWAQFKSMDPFQRAAMRTQSESAGVPWESVAQQLRGKWASEGGPTQAPNTSQLAAATQDTRGQMGREQIASTFGSTPEEYWRGQSKGWAKAGAAQVQQAA